MFQQLIRRGALAGLIVALAGCSAQPPTSGAAPPPAAQPAAATGVVGERFKLAYGESATITDTGLIVSFNEVVEDSRCPANAMCARQGEAVVAGELSGPGAPGAFRLPIDSADSAAASVAAGAYRLRAVALDPYPGTTEQSSPEDYVLTLVVEAAGG